MIDKAADSGAEIVCLPEMITTGYNLKILKERINKLAVKSESQYIKKFCNNAKKNNITIMLPLALKSRDNSIFNSTLIINNKGEVMGEYSKTHLFSIEKEYFKPDDEFKIFNIDNFKFSVLICYDLGFPETARLLTLKGADVIFVPAVWRIQDIEVWDLNTRQRAQENNIFICGVNRVGKKEKLHLFGGSRIVDPYGNVVVHGPLDKELVIVEEINLSEIKNARNNYNYLNDRRNDLYGDFK